MPIITGTRHVKLKIFLYLLGAVALCAVLAVFIAYRMLSDRPEALLPLIDNAANLSIGSVHQTSSRDGIAQWSLDASSAHFFEERKETVFETPKVIFYTKDNDKIHMSAAEGILDMDTRDIFARHDVVVRYSGYIMKTPSLHYNNKMRIMFSNTPVRISGKSIQLTADSMVMYLDTGKIDFTGQVEGYLIGNFTF